uniref:Outer membrane autotransporter barrel domain-containing protein n=1 Tax=Ochrobactrum sp. LM19 TaxID=1449781 RepID=A0A0D5A0U4_9HYPH|nr:autotransporter outer membrane beta-barrel domain-containing protein [Ochrobactrum sp. LM19]AJW29930.1 outer membrane autotransporter barrel domain-containing protein [Ochrobactrum sp. LM19]
MSRIKSRLFLTASVLAISAFAHSTQAQQIVADGTIVIAPANVVINTGAADEVAGYAMAARNGGSIDASGGVALTTGGIKAYGIISGAGSSVLVSTGTIVTTGDEAYGLYATTASTIHADNLTINSSGTGAISQWAGSNITISDSIITSTNGFGLHALNGGTIDATDVVITSNSRWGVEAYGSGSIITLSTNRLDQNKVTAAGLNGFGLYARNSGQIISNGDLLVTTSGASASGALAQANSAITSNAAITIETSGTNSHGAFALTSSKIAFLGGGTVSTTGAGSNGLWAFGAGSSVETVGVETTTTGVGANGANAQVAGEVTLTNSTVTTQGGNAHGLAVSDGGVITATGTEVTAIGAGSAGVFAAAGAGNAANTVSITGGVLDTAQGDLVRSEGGALDVTLDSVTTNNGSGIVLNVLDDTVGNHGNVNFSALNTVLTGNVIAAADNIANVSLSASSLTGAADNATNVSLDADSVWNMTASSTVSDTVTNAGLIAFEAPAGGIFKTLTTTNYTGDNGTVALNTHLGADASPSDQIVINGGAATGQTGLAISNINGAGAPTTDGVKVVDAINGGTTTADAFFLGNGDYVTEDGQNAKIAGAYAYTLHRSPVSSGSDVYGDGYATDDWYLRSVMTPVTPDPEPDPEPEPEPEPRYNPGVPVYETYPSTLQILNRLPTLAQRTGNRYWREAAPAQTVFCKDPAQNFRCIPNQEQNAYYQDGATTIVGGNNVWGRIEGLHGRQQPDVTTSRSDYDYNLWKLQAGVDGQFYESEAGKLIGGVTVHYGQVSTDVSSIFGDGTIDTSGYGFGGTLTWYGNNGFYLDAQGQVTWYDSDLYSDTLRNGLANGNDGFGYAVSLEAGKRIGLNENWTLTPQAQLTWSSVDFDSFTDPYGARVSLDKGDSLKGRLGLALGHERSWKDTEGQTSRAQVYGVVNLGNEFLDGTKVDVSGTKFDSRTDRLTGGIGIGGTYSWANDKYAIFGEVNADTSLRNFADSYEVGGTLGLRVKF